MNEAKNRLNHRSLRKEILFMNYIDWVESQIIRMLACSVLNIPKSNIILTQDTNCFLKILGILLFIIIIIIVFIFIRHFN